MNIEQIKQEFNTRFCHLEPYMGDSEHPHYVINSGVTAKPVLNFIEQKLNLVAKEAEQNAYRRMIDEYKDLFGMGLPFHKVISGMASKFINSLEEANKDE